MSARPSSSARNHNHAVTLQALFEEMYPQYMKPKQEFCAVIDNYVDRAEQLIDDFKGEGNNPNLHIAISVDMLDKRHVKSVSPHRFRLNSLDWEVACDSVSVRSPEHDPEDLPPWE